MPSAERIDQLRRRLEENPASLAFGPLAEEYRKAGRLDEAIATCRAGLEHHPGYVAARVTLGRALLDAGDTAGAQAEFERVVLEAPENLAAIRGLAEIHRRPLEGAEAARPAAAPIPVSPLTSPVEAPAGGRVAPAATGVAPGGGGDGDTAGLQQFLHDIATARTSLRR
jgi:tetratricopeptide (TPR) repeat protein